MIKAKVLSVDDDRTLNHLTLVALHRFNRPEMQLEVTSVHSAAEAKSVLDADPFAYAAIILDVIMEHPSAGFDVVNYLRNDLKNSRTQILIRSGQPGGRTKEDVMRNHQINQYYDKLELRNLTVLRTVVEDAVKAYLADEQG